MSFTQKQKEIAKALAAHAIAWSVSVVVFLGAWQVSSFASSSEESTGITDIITDMKNAVTGTDDSDLLPGQAPTSSEQNVIPPVHYLEETGGIYPGEITEDCTEQLHGVIRYNNTTDTLEYCSTTNEWRSVSEVVSCNMVLGEMGVTSGVGQIGAAHSCSLKAFISCRLILGTLDSGAGRLGSNYRCYLNL